MLEMFYDNHFMRRKFMTKREERLRKIEILNQQKENLAFQLESIEKVKAFVQFPILTGRQVRNKKLGIGTIGESGGQYFSVEFSSGVKKYAFPDSFAKGFLEIDDEELVNSCKKYAELLEKEEALKTDVKKIEQELATV